MRMFFTGERDVYVEIAERYAEYIRRGILRNGEKLPSVRVAAGEFGVNPNTVERAYVQLERDGLVSILPKKGAFVTFSGEDRSKGNVNLRDVVSVLTKLKNSGFDKEDILSALEEVFDNA